MSGDRENLTAIARAACESAHAPYSGIHVGAAIRSVAGATYTGTNVENAAYPLGNCAEASAIAAGVQAEGARFRIAETAVWASDREGRADRDLSLRRLPPAHPRVRRRRPREGALPVGQRDRSNRDRGRTPALRLRAAWRARAVTWLPQESIRIKRDGGALDADDLARIARAIADGSLSDAQVGAFAMAVQLRGMTAAECAAFTLAVRDSGEVFDWRAESPPGPVLDKHSTGGVGDLVSLALGPMLAACGAWVPMIVGRGLAHTGGTLDKLESIPGYQSRPPPERVRRAVREAGVAIVGAGDRIAPADRRLYAIRDVTATVDCLPLIVASILSKKLAAGLEALVLDIKFGNGAVLPEHERGRELARAMISTAAAAGLPMSALLTDMSEPLARSAGNALEVHEAIAMLRGETPDRAPARSHPRAGTGSDAARQAREGCEVGAFRADALDHERCRGGALLAHGREPRRAGRHPGKAGCASREGGGRGRRARGP